MKERVLIIDDQGEQCELLGELVAALDYAPVTTTQPAEALDRITRENFDAVLTDLEMASMSGVDVCKGVSVIRSDVPVILVTGMASMDSAVAALRAGAYDFLTKPVDANVLGLTLKRAIDHRKLRAEVKLLRASAPDQGAGGMVGDSPALCKVREMVARVAPRDVSVLIEGETGTGKELVARAIHRSSSRHGGPFVAINCASIPATLLESELFGHTRGAFTDAKTARDGLFVQASGGTLFLDEIGEMPLEMQAKLLRALQERTCRPVGSNGEVPFDTRIVAATHRDLEFEIESRRFREDLYYRINVVKISIPPLRERGNDVLLLAANFLQKAAERNRQEPLSLSPQVAALLLAYDWPGNVRELENCIERAVALARFSELSAEDLPDKVRSYSPRRFVVSADTESEILSLDELERRYILRALKILNGNRSRAATVLGLDRRTLYRRLERYDADGGGVPPSGGSSSKQIAPTS
ncbi:MAG TPA: sigma-54 dependent transcriptional regulator [Polyangiaceae bacterium]|nr:sigma-54 dependent transcriptional regulator [Polyangiaceae bacterium]